MSAFTEFKSYKLLEGTTYILEDDLVWHVGRYPSPFIFNIEKGKTFDISVPKIFRRFISPHDSKMLLASAVHDHLIFAGFNEEFCTQEFIRAALALGNSKFHIFPLSILVYLYRKISNKFPSLKRFLFENNQVNEV